MIVQEADYLLSQSRVFGQLDGRIRDRIAAALKVKKLDGGQTLFSRNAPVDGCYLIESGTLKVSIEDFSGEETWLAILSRGDVAGEVGLVDRNPRSATVSAMTDARLLRLSVTDFDRLARDCRELYEALVVLVCERLRHANLRLCNQRLGLEGRLAHVVMQLQEAFGEDAGGGEKLIRYRIGQARLAEVAGASRENVNRQLRLWRSTGICTRDGSYYRVLDPGRLQRIARHDISAWSG